MKRTVTQKPLERGLVRYTYRYEGDDAQVCTVMYRKAQLDMLTEFVNNPVLLECGMGPFDSFRMYHDGVRWVAELEATGK